jgi:phosphopantothenoylcysteine decarboxylase/phosphopantothenate--cysteine ligase
MNSLAGKHVLIGITGGIAAYKLPFLVRLLRAQDAEVRILMTPAAADFVTPLTLAALSGQPVHHHLVDRRADQTAWNNHVAHAEWADLFILAPATANTLAKAVQGLCDNLVMATYLSAKCPVLWAPAMDLDMYQHPAVLENLKTLSDWGQYVLDSPAGPLASGLNGAGRMAEPETIFHHARRILLASDYWKGKQVLLTSGPTQEALDAVRYITNGSSGRMGDAFAKALSSLGAELTWVYGPSAVQTPNLPGVQYVPVQSADEMFEACAAVADAQDILVFSAAVADYKPAKVHSGKLKKADGPLSIDWVETPDILKTIGQSKKPHQRILGFALESEWNEGEAIRKCESKNADAIVLNQAGDPEGGMHTETNRVALISRTGSTTVPVQAKDDVAWVLLNWMETTWNS